MKVSDVKPIAMAEAKEILSTREKEKKELSYEQKLALDHLKKFNKVKYDDAKKLWEELNKILRMSPETTAQIINILPKNPDELRMLFAREKFSLKEDEVTKILEAIKKYA